MLINVVNTCSCDEVSSFLFFSLTNKCKTNNTKDKTMYSVCVSVGVVCAREWLERSGGLGCWGGVLRCGGSNQRNKIIEESKKKIKRIKI